MRVLDMHGLVKTITGAAILIALAFLSFPLAQRLGERVRGGRVAGSRIPEVATVRVGGVVFRAEVVRTPASRERGLGGRRSLGANEGMLFVFDTLDYQTIWMAGMRFSIDVLWISDGRVVDVRERLPVPKSGETYLPLFNPREKALLVLEVPAGTAAGRGFKAGDPVEVRFDGS